MKNPFKKDKYPKTQAPRELVEIQKEYQQLSAQAANAQYLVFIKKEELSQINLRLMAVNKEAGKRQELEAAKKAEAEKQLAVKPGESNGKS